MHFKAHYADDMRRGRTDRYTIAAQVQQTSKRSPLRLQTLLRRPPLTMFDPP